MEQGNSEKYIGLVKWFHDQAKNANYGFIQHAILGDLFFHEKSIEKGQEISSFTENEIVVFNSIKSKKHQDKLEAVDVKLLKTENDLKFLFEHFLLLLTAKGKYSDYNIIQKGIHLRITEILSNNQDKNLNEELYKSIQQFIDAQIILGTLKDETFIRGFLNVCKNYFQNHYSEICDKIEQNINVESAHNLWLDKYFDKCQISFISAILLDSDNSTKSKIFDRCTNEDKSNIFFKIIYRFEHIDSDFKLDTIKKFLKLSSEFAAEQHSKILSSTLQICPDYYKLNLWLEDFHEDFDFNLYKLYTITLTPEDQKRFVKKTLKYIHEGKAAVSIEDFTSINIIDYETSKYAEDIDNSRLDYSTSIILNVISELHSEAKLETRKDTIEAQQRIFDLIIKQIKKPDDILQITGYFDECEGRCNISFNEEKNENGEVISRTPNYTRNEHNKPKLHSICDGRKALDNKTKLPSISEEGVEFWWCGNQKCFKPSRELHSSDNWQKYSLIDFLTILKVNFKEKDLELYLNLINKANRFLKHLNCRTCKHILRPIKQSNYAFYGVNDFHCINENCEEKGKRIYLTHCLNGKCEQAIDSRDSVKCKPDGFESEKCGWYICNYCNSCCSNEGIERRLYIYNRTGQEYKCHTQGHRNLGIICCNKCGNSMDSNKHDKAEYKKVLMWFIENKENQDYVVKSGQNQSGKWWFRFKKHHKLSHDEYYKKLENLVKLGFNIPNFDEYERTTQLISESNSKKSNEGEILVCSNAECKHILDLTSDLERAFAIKRFHNVRFVRQQSENQNN